MSITDTTPSNERPQPKTARELIAANVQTLIQQLEAGHSDALTAYLNAMSDFTVTASETFWKLPGRSPTQPV